MIDIPNFMDAGIGSHMSRCQPLLQFVKGARKLLMGTNPDVDSYSLFYDNYRTNGGMGSTGLDIDLTDNGVKTVVMSGIATDYVVGRTALDTLDLGFTTFVVEDLIRGITNEGINEWRSKIIGNGGIIVATARQMAEDSTRWKNIKKAYPPTSGATNLVHLSSRELRHYSLSSLVPRQGGYVHFW